MNLKYKTEVQGLIQLHHDSEVLLEIKINWDSPDNLVTLLKQQKI